MLAIHENLPRLPPIQLSEKWIKLQSLWFMSRRRRVCSAVGGAKFLWVEIKNAKNALDLVRLCPFDRRRMCPKAPVDIRTTSFTRKIRSSSALFIFFLHFYMKSEIDLNFKLCATNSYLSAPFCCLLIFSENQQTVSGDDNSAEWDLIVSVRFNSATLLCTSSKFQLLNGAANWYCWEKKDFNGMPCDETESSSDKVSVSHAEKKSERMVCRRTLSTDSIWILNEQQKDFTVSHPEKFSIDIHSTTQYDKCEYAFYVTVSKMFQFNA